MLIDTNQRSDHRVEEDQRRTSWSRVSVLGEYFELALSSRLSDG